MAKWRSGGDVSLELRGPAMLFEPDGVRVDDFGEVGELRLTPEPLDQHIADTLYDDGVRGGIITLIGKNGVLEWRVQFEAPDKLSSQQRTELMEEFLGQVTDGAGENGFEVEIRGRCLHAELDISGIGPSTPWKVKALAKKPKAARGGASLHAAIRAEQNDEVVIALIGLGTGLEKVERYGATPIFTASLERRWPIVRALILAGVNLEHRMDSGTTPLMHVIMSCAPADVVALFIERGADVHARDDEGYTALHWAANRVAPETVELLLKAGVDPNSRSQLGRTPEFMAVDQGDDETCAKVMETLARHGATMQFSKPKSG